MRRVEAVRDCGLRSCQATQMHLQGRILEYHGIENPRS